MAMVEVDENQLAAMQRVNGFVQAGLNNPATRRKVLELQKELNPKAVIPELDAIQPVNEALTSVRDELALLRAERAKADEERKLAEAQSKARGEWNSGRKKLRQAGWNDEGVKVIEEFMEKRGIADHEVAAAAYEHMNPVPQAPSGSVGNRFDIFGAREGEGKNALKQLFEGKENDFLNMMIPKALAEVRGTNRQ